MFGFLTKTKFNHVGTVQAYSYAVDDEGETTGYIQYGYYVLRENGYGLRKYDTTGYTGNSTVANRVKAQVLAWTNGGPLPELFGFENPLDVDAPEKQPKPEAKLIVFPGGKDTRQDN